MIEGIFTVQYYYSIGYGKIYTAIVWLNCTPASKIVRRIYKKKTVSFTLMMQIIQKYPFKNKYSNV